MSETTGTSSFLQELEEWYTWLDNALVLNALMRVADEETEQSSTGTCLLTLSHVGLRWSALNWVYVTILGF